MIELKDKDELAKKKSNTRKNLLFKKINKFQKKIINCQFLSRREINFKKKLLIANFCLEELGLPKLLPLVVIT